MIGLVAATLYYSGGPEALRRNRRELILFAVALLLVVALAVGYINDPVAALLLIPLWFWSIRAWQFRGGRDRMREAWRSPRYRVFFVVLFGSTFVLPALWRIVAGQ